MIKTKDQIEKIRMAGKIFANVKKEIMKKIDIGVSLKEIDNLIEKLIKEAGAKPAFLGYQPSGATKPFPASACTSLNEVVVHGIPNNYKLKNGDILKVDFGVSYENYIADSAFTVGVGQITPEAKRLMDATEKALEIGIKECVPGKTVGDIGWAINNYITKQKFKVIKGLCGHGVGKKLHEDPAIYNEGVKSTGMKLKKGMVLAIEPMISAGSAFVDQTPEDSYATRDKSLTAHFEHTILITSENPEILTK